MRNQKSVLEISEISKINSCIVEIITSADNKSLTKSVEIKKSVQIFYHNLAHQSKTTLVALLIHACLY